MDMTSAVASCMRGYARFEGRAPRSEYWWFALFSTVVGLLCGVIDQAAGVRVLGPLSSIALFLPGVAVAVRRLHDTDHSGWWYLGLWLLVPIVWIFQRGTDGPNRFGPDPLGRGVDPAPRTSRAVEGAVRDGGLDESPAVAMVERAIRRLSTQGRGVSVPMAGVAEQTTFDLGCHDGGSRAYAMFTRDADEVRLQLDFDVPSPDVPGYEQVVARLARELAMQAESRLPRLAHSVAEDAWERAERARQPRPPLAALSPRPTAT